jgi:hypothetical protein
MPTLDAKGVTLYYEENGGGVPVVFVPGQSPITGLGTT